MISCTELRASLKRKNSRPLSYFALLSRGGPARPWYSLNLPLLLNADERLRLSYAVTEILAETPTPQAAMQEILASLGKATGLQAGSFFVLHEEAIALLCVFFWKNAEQGFPNFEMVTHAWSFAYGEGLPGMAWKECRPVWIANLVEHKNFPRASVAKMDGLVSGVAFPLHAGKRVVGAIELLSTVVYPPDPAMLEFFAALGGQIGIFLSHYRITDSVQQIEAEFHLIAEASTDAVITIDEESTIVYASTASEAIFGYRPEELIGHKLTMIMPDDLRPRHEQGIRHYVETGQRHLHWGEVRLPGLHKNGSQIPLGLAFGEFWRGGKRLFTGFARAQEPAEQAARSLASSPKLTPD
jgi:PAS domain S-box-containing protein